MCFSILTLNYFIPMDINLSAFNILITLSTYLHDYLNKINIQQWNTLKYIGTLFFAIKIHNSIGNVFIYKND